jgi:hypothetical protein
MTFISEYKIDILFIDNYYQFIQVSNIQWLFHLQYKIYQTIYCIIKKNIYFLKFRKF